MDPLENYGLDPQEEFPNANLETTLNNGEPEFASYRPTRAETEYNNTAVRLLNVMDRRASAQMRHVMEYYRHLHM